MAKSLDNILVVDVEATCWERSNSDGMENDIIEIGACLLILASAISIEVLP